MYSGIQIGIDHAGLLAVGLRELPCYISLLYLFRRHVELRFPPKQEGSVKLRFPRHPARCSITFSGKAASGVGTLTNLTNIGCKVESAKSVPEGAALALRISLLDHEAAINVDQAVVIWSKGREFGLRFIEMRAQAQGRLRRFVQVLSSRRAPVAKEIRKNAPIRSVASASARAKL